MQRFVEEICTLRGELAASKLLEAQAKAAKEVADDVHALIVDRMHAFLRQKDESHRLEFDKGMKMAYDEGQKSIVFELASLWKSYEFAAELMYGVSFVSHSK